MNAATSRVELLSFDQFEASREAWNELAISTLHPLPFMTHEWLSTWWKHFGQQQEFVALVHSDSTGWVAAVPLALRSTRFLGRRVKVAEIVGTGPVPTRGMGLSDKADLLEHHEHPGASRPLVEKLAELLERADVVDIKGIAGDSPAGQALGDAHGNPAALRLHRSVSPFLPLPGSWADYLESRSGNFRKHLRKYRRNLEAAGSVETAVMQPGDDAAAWMQEIVPVNHASWKGERGTNLFRHPALSAFFGDVVAAMATPGWIDLRVLRLDGHARAYELCFDFGGRLFSYNSGFDKNFSDLSPGTALTAWVIEAACDRGLTEYDMLRGEETYKTRWSSTTRQESRVLLNASRLRARLYLRCGILFKERLKRSERLREWDDRLSGWLSRRQHGNGSGRVQ